MLAGEPGDRWLRLCNAGFKPGIKVSGREESPDTIVVGSREPDERATRLVTPGERQGSMGFRLCRPMRSRIVPQRTYRRRSSTVASRRKNLRDVFASLARLARVKRWGKSP